MADHALDGQVAEATNADRPEGPARSNRENCGFRRGTDVLKALALGAKFVLVGRPFNYAAAAAGEAGVRQGIGLLRDEVSRDMAMLGVTAPSEVTADVVAPSRSTRRNLAPL